MLLKKFICFIMLISISLCCSCLCEDACPNIGYFQEEVNGKFEDTDTTLGIGDAARHWLQRNEKECPSCGVIYHGTCCPNSKCPMNQKDAKEKNSEVEGVK